MSSARFSANIALFCLFVFVVTSLVNQPLTLSDVVLYGAVWFTIGAVFDAIGKR